MALLTGRPRGTIDVLPAEVGRWHQLEAAVRGVAARFGFGEIRTPLIEHAELYVRTSGDTSDIVEKETYTFADRGGRMLTLRPEGTPGVVRAFLEHGLQNEALPAKFYYLGPMFRYDRPQAGRYRQHTQFGIEIFGAPGPDADLEAIMVAVTLLRELGLGHIEVQLNSIGCPHCRPAYREALVAYYEARRADLCPDCQRRLTRNPLRLLDCKVEECAPHKAGAPASHQHLCGECGAHFQRLQELLDRFGIGYRLDPLLVRGLDYYTRTVFELVHHGLGSQGAVCAGGRYDGLIESAGGPPLAGVGFGMGLERVLLTLEQEGKALVSAPAIDVFVAAASGDAASSVGVAEQVLASVYALRWSGLSAECDLMGRSLRQQLRYADRRGARLMVVIGPDEVTAGAARIRDMVSGVETPAGLGQLAAVAAGILSAAAPVVEGVPG